MTEPEPFIQNTDLPTEHTEGRHPLFSELIFSSDLHRLAGAHRYEKNLEQEAWPGSRHSHILRQRVAFRFF